MFVPDGYSLHSYGRMVADDARTRPFVEALRQTIRPESVVLDIGTGAGFFALVAAQLGAARVYAIEPDDAIDVAKLCAARTENRDRITWVQGISTQIDLPERVDVVVADLHGNLPFHNGMIASLIDARSRHLKPDGIIFPARDVLRVVPATAPLEYAELERPWGQNDYSLDLGAGRRFVANSWWRARQKPIGDAQLLSEPETWGVIDYLRVQSANLDNSLQFTLHRKGTMHGYYVWFDGEMMDRLGYSNAPNLPELVYGRTFFPLEQPVEVEPGERVDLRLSTKLMDGNHFYRWDSRFMDGEGALRAHFRQSTFNSRPIQRRHLQASQSSYVAALSKNGEAAQTVLNAISRAQSLGDIAQLLVRDFPRLFDTPASATDYVMKLIGKYAEPDAGSRSESVSSLRIQAPT